MIAWDVLAVVGAWIGAAIAWRFGIAAMNTNQKANRILEETLQIEQGREQRELASQQEANVRGHVEPGQGVRYIIARNYGPGVAFKRVHNIQR